MVDGESPGIPLVLSTVCEHENPRKDHRKIVVSWEFIGIYHQVMTNIAIEHGPLKYLIFPQEMVIFHIYVNAYQRVDNQWLLSMVIFEVAM